jgi:hypothetical protein
MPELPDHPDIDQLRHQARDLHRAAAAGAPEAVARIRKFSDRMALSTAQLALAREYGYPSWPALRAEVERRDAMLRASRPQFAEAHPDAPAAWPDRRYSFGGGAAIQSADGVLTPDVLTAGLGLAELHAYAELAYTAGPARRLRLLSRGKQQPGPRFDDLSAVDDRGRTYGLSFGSGSLHFNRPDRVFQRSEVSFYVDPVPPAETSWIEVRAGNGLATRLIPSPRAAVRVSDVAAVPASKTAERRLDELAYWLLNLSRTDPGSGLSRELATALVEVQQQEGELEDASELPEQLQRLCSCLADQHLASDLPASWRHFLEAANQADGPRRHLDLAVAVPQLEGLSVQLDHLVSRPDSWSLYLRAEPTWWDRSEDGHRKVERVCVRGDDDQGGRYASTFGGGGNLADSNCEELKLEFVPRIDPLARRLKLTFAGEAAETAVELDLPSAAA